MKTHTAGPWSVSPTQADHGDTTSITDRHGFEVARIRSRAWDRDARLVGGNSYDRANAALIAAAPELLAMLRSTLQMYCSGPKQAVAAKALLRQLDEVKP